MNAKRLAIGLVYAIILAVAFASAVITRNAQDVDGIRSEGVPVTCWHFRE